MTAEARPMTPGQKAWATRRARLGLSPTATTGAESIEDQRRRWQAEYERRCAESGKRPGPEWDPDRLRAQGYDDLADHVLRTWCKGWRAPKPRISRKLVARHNAKKAGQKARRDWTF
jgi:hypothetical protein